MGVPVLLSGSEGESGRGQTGPEMHPWQMSLPRSRSKKRRERRGRRRKNEKKKKKEKKRKEKTKTKENKTSALHLAFAWAMNTPFGELGAALAAGGSKKTFSCLSLSPFFFFSFFFFFQSLTAIDKVDLGLCADQSRHHQHQQHKAPHDFFLFFA
jgi:hypothetical protein